ncbi:PREDICTED: pentatricopeptide repeat-containing protein At3g18110, chloroplastic isoform X1 [Ipomoea nil]|uniref:pentatricopeptide repeat-containing protein At3g18110, chloroplastic isoform X1 n=1 Tax=Ipomoea nil TaxID=35883 RepID=UPI000901E623|nr:PREDICTED: pentatricopeptide repeat-containing protein At3g18110, chloroplastic isoform X1 [Ipomoea nil]
MACSAGVLSFATPLMQKSKVRQRPSTSSSSSSSLDCTASTSSSASASASATSTTSTEQDSRNKFSYSRASPSVRWPHLTFTDTQRNSQRFQSPPLTPIENDSAFEIEVNDESQEEEDLDGGRTRARSRTKAKKMTKLALKRDKDWRKRVQFLTEKILQLKSEEFVADVLDEKLVQMTPTDFCFVVKWVGKSSWQRALEIYEWLNLRHWYSPNARMLATILGVLGKANQQVLAVEIFTRAEPTLGNTVQVYNAMMGVYARNGQFLKVQELLNLMRKRGCDPDLVSFNTLINARLKSGPMAPGLAIELLDNVRSSGLRPDIITYNTLISACSRESNLKEAVKVFSDMETNRCQPDLWTYNAMISVFGRCGLASEAEKIFKDLEFKGFYPDAVTYNSLLYAFAKEGNLEKVKETCEEMIKMGFGKDEMTYNTMLHMYGKKGQHDLALQLYREMKSLGRDPDVVTYTILIDSLGKTNKMTEAANMMSEMLNSGIKPTVKTYCALICGYAKSGRQTDAEEMFNCMTRSGIKPDRLAYSVMLDMHLRSNQTKKAMLLYHDMINDGYAPELSIYESILKVLRKENDEEGIQKVITDLEELCNLSPEGISSLLVKGECYNLAAKMLKLSITQGYKLDKDNLLSILGSYSSSGNHSEAIELLNFVKEHVEESQKFLSEAMIVMLCKANQLTAALDEYFKSSNYSSHNGSFAVFEYLIKCCEADERFAEASQIFSDMRASGLELSQDVYRTMATIYLMMGFPETGHYLVNQAEAHGIPIDDVSIYVGLIEAYGKLKLLEKAEDVVATLKRRCNVVDRKAWNALIQAYAVSGLYEKARAVFNRMMRDGPSPTVDTVNSLMQALIVDDRLNELYVVIQELQDMGFKISKSTIILMLDAFAKAGNIFEVKKIYHGMKAAGYFPTMHLYRVMIGLLSRAKRVTDVEAMLSEMEELGFKPDLSVWNSMLKLYTKIEDFKKTVYIYQRIQEAGLKPDAETYNTLIIMYCRDRCPERGFSLMQEMRQQGLNPEMDTYKSLIAAFCKELMVEQAEELFECLKSEGHKLDRSFYHLMMKMYRSSGNSSKAEQLILKMEESGIQPSTATMHLLMTSYGSSGHPREADKVLNDLKSTGATLSTLPYGSVIDSYLKNGDYNIGIQKLKDMIEEGPEPDHRIWTCFTRAASLCDHISEAKILLTSVADAGFDLPLRLLTEQSESLVLETDQYLEQIASTEDDAAFNFVNALEDLLWAFEQRATASWIFQLAIKKSIYRHDVFRVADKDWGADFRKLSAGAALVGLTLWLDHMQDASLEGFPESPKSIVLITGTAEYNKVSLNSTLKAYLWEMGSPFLPCKTQTGILIAKGHSLRMWLKDSPFCLDLELKNRTILSETNSMHLIEGCFVRRGLVPAYKDITERLGLVPPKKFSRLALLPDEKRERVINADIEGRKGKLVKSNKTGITRKKKITNFRKKRLLRRTHP